MKNHIFQTTAPKLNALNFPYKFGKVLEADHHQKVVLKFSVTDKLTKEKMKVHQVMFDFIF